MNTKWERVLVGSKAVILKHIIVRDSNYGEAPRPIIHPPHIQQAFSA